MRHEPTAAPPPSSFPEERAPEPMPEPRPVLRDPLPLRDRGDRAKAGAVREEIPPLPDLKVLRQTPTQERPAAGQSSGSQATLPDIPSDVIMFSTERKESRPSPYQTATSPRKRGVMVLLAGIVALLVLASLFLLLPELSRLLQGGAPLPKATDHPGARALAALAEQVGPIKGNHLELVKQAELAFQRDLPEDYLVALDLFRRALVLNPQNPESIVRYVESHVVAQSQPVRVEAIRELMDLLDYAVTLAPDLSSIRRAKARVFIALGQWRRAEEAAERARRLEPRNQENQVVLGTTLIDSDPNRAVEILSPLVEEPRPPKIAFSPLARAYEELGNLFMAEQTYLKRDEIDPGTCALCQPLAEMYVSMGHYDKARAVYNRLVESRPHTPQGVLGLAYAAWLAGLPVSQILGNLQAVTEETLSAYRPDDQVWYLCSAAHYAILSGSFESARSRAGKALEHDRNSLCARYLLVLAGVLGKNALSDSGATYTEIMEGLTIDAPAQPEIWTLRALYAIRVGEFKDAIAFLQTAIRVDPAYRAAHLLLAKLYLEAQNIRRAVDAIDALARFSPDYWEDHPDRNLLTDRFDFADDLLRQLDELDHGQVDLDRKHQVIGLVALYAGQTERARHAFTTVLANNRRDIQSNLNLAFIGLREGRFAVARQYAEAVLDEDRNHAHASLALAQALDREGNRRAAVQRVARILGVHSESAALLALSAELAMREGRGDQARIHAQMAYRVDPASMRVRRARYLTRM